jgi:hypothetical protein
MRKLSDRIWDAWRVGGKGWTADDLVLWMAQAERMERALRLQEVELGALRKTLAPNAASGSKPGQKSRRP